MTHQKEASPHPSNTIVMRDLARFGPESPPAEAMSLEAALAYVHGLARGHRENFHVLSRFVPAAFRDDFAAVYAFCRWADDLGDETGRDEAARERALELLGWWRGLLVQAVGYARQGEEKVEEEEIPVGDRCHRGEDHQAGPPTHPVMIALAETIRRRGLDDRPFHDLIDAFEQDQRVTRYRSWEELLGYCRKSADPVGRIVLQLAGCDPRDPANGPTVAQSDAICTALQLTNFWQDVRRDLLERDRIYLPMEEVGFGEAELRGWIAEPNDSAGRVRYIKSVRGLVRKTQTLYDAGRDLPEALGPGFGRVVGLFMAGGEATQRAIERAGCTTLWLRPRLGGICRTSLIASALLRR